MCLFNQVASSKEKNNCRKLKFITIKVLQNCVDTTIPEGKVSGLLGINLEDVQDANYNAESETNSYTVMLIEVDVFQLSQLFSLRAFQFNVNT